MTITKPSKPAQQNTGLSKLIANEPAITGAIMTLVIAAIGLGVQIGFDISDGLSLAIQGFVAALITMFFIVVRTVVVPVSKVEESYTKDENVVEVAVDGQVVAGPANELRTGSVIRDLNDQLPPYMEGDSITQ